MEKTNEIKEFLAESNAIERVYSDEALDDAIKAWNFGLKKEIDLNLILGIHKRLMKNLNKRIAGNMRECAVYIGGDIRNQSKQQITDELNYLCTIHPKTEEEIKEWHVAFEKTHPFEDGNGRTGRILMNLQRVKKGLPILIIHEGREQMQYYKWFKK